ncbi:MAG: hypothetical protein K2L70_04080 [Clostridia bacterium]|nr:hypothetical protein [Clostridia bacterium]
MDEIKQKLKMNKVLIFIISLLILLVTYITVSLVTDFFPTKKGNNDAITIIVCVPCIGVALLFGWIFGKIMEKSLKQNKLCYYGKTSLSKEEISGAREYCEKLVKEKGLYKYISIPSDNKGVDEEIDKYNKNNGGYGYISKYDFAEKVNKYLRQNTCLNEIESSINRYDNLVEVQKVFFSKEERKGKLIAFIGIGLAIPFLICGILLQVLLNSQRISGWLLSLPYSFLPFFAVLISYGFKVESNFLNASLAVHCIKYDIDMNKCSGCGAIGSLVSDSNVISVDKYSKVYDYESHYGTIGEVYADREKIGEVKGITGYSIARERQPYRVNSHNIKYCRCCLYRRESNSSKDYEGEWKNL